MAMKHASSLLLAAGLAAAQSSTTVSMLMPLATDGTMGASVISAGPTATTYLLACPSSVAESDCPVDKEGVTFTYGPSTMAYVLSLTGDDSGDVYTMSAACNLTPSANVASCTGAYIMEGTTSAFAEDETSYSEYVVPVLVTAGVEKLNGGDAETTATTTATETATNTASTTLTTTTGAPTTTGGNGNGNGEGEGEGSETATETTSTSTGGVPKVTQNAVVLGAAALVGGVMMM